MEGITQRTGQGVRQGTQEAPGGPEGWDQSNTTFTFHVPVHGESPLHVEQLTVRAINDGNTLGICEAKGAP